MKYAVGISCIIFLILKFLNLDIRLSDTNIYFYTAYQLTQGNLLYKDLFFTNLPFFPYISTVYFLLGGGNILFYQATAFLEIIICAILIYLIVRKYTNNSFISFVSFITYLFSFIILATSDHQTGVFLASLCALGGIHVWQYKKYVFAGILFGLAVMTKAYFIPIFIAFIIYHLLIKQLRITFKLCCGFVISTLVILTPFLFLSFDAFIKDIIQYSLVRSAGISKLDIVWFAITKDPLLIILFIFSLLSIKKNILFGLLSITALLFFIGYKDIYYLYLNFAACTIPLTVPLFLESIKSLLHLQRFVLPSIIFLMCIINIVVYQTSYTKLQTISNFSSVIEVIKKQNPSTLYGTNDIAPLIAYETKIPLLNNIVDTNTNIFRKKFLDATNLTQQAMHKKSILIAHGVEYPELNISEEIIDEIFDKDLVRKHCRKIHSTSIQVEGVANRLNIFKCF